MNGFWGHGQQEETGEFVGKYFEALKAMKSRFGQKEKTFMRIMLPKMAEVEDKHIVALVALKQDTHDTDKVFSSMTQDAIESLVRIKEIRNYCRQ